MAHPTDAGLVSGTFTATGQSLTLTGKVIDVSLTGGATATVAVQRKVNGTWGTIESITGDGERVIENGQAFEHRLNCTAYTSGTVTYAMVGK